MHRRRLAICVILGFIALAAGAQDALDADTQAHAAAPGRSGDPALLIEPSDLVITQSIEGGYDLWVRGKPGLGSILLTESSADPEMRVDSYALRDPTVHAAAEGERRILDGKLLEEKGARSIVDSTLEPSGSLGAAFHVFIPYLVTYGYPWSRSGETQILDGTFINIRAFGRAQADYGGPYRDNPFRLSVTQKARYVPPPLEPPAAESAPEEPAPADPLPESAPGPTPPPAVYMPDAVKALSEIAESAKGTAELSTGEDDLGEKIGSSLDEAGAGSLDLVLALDTTNSMRDDMVYLRGSIVDILREHTSRFPSFRVGLLLYRDYNDEYLVKPMPFVADLAAMQGQIDAVQVGGGRDIPEAVYEALNAAIHRYEWRAESRLVLLIGDAPPHPLPRGKITKEIVYRDADALGIRVNTIILPP